MACFVIFVVVLFQKLGTPPAYPLRTAQRNLNKILFGAAVSNDPSEEFAPSGNRAKTISPPKTLLEIDNLIDKILDAESSSSSVYNSSATVPTTATKEPSATDCYQPPQQYEPTANESYRSQDDLRRSQALSSRSVDNSHSTAKLYGNDVAPLLQINNSTAAAAATTNQTKGVRNALISEMVDFNSLNSMISTQQDNGEWLPHISSSHFISLNCEYYRVNCTNGQLTTNHKSSPIHLDALSVNRNESLNLLKNPIEDNFSTGTLVVNACEFFIKISVSYINSHHSLSSCWAILTCHTSKDKIKKNQRHKSG